jgi:hypothetical protein
LQVDDEFEFGRLHHRQVDRLLALEDVPGIDSDLPKDIRKVRSIAHQPAGFGILAPEIKRGHPVVGCQRHDLYATIEEHIIGTDQDCIGPLLCKARKGDPGIPIPSLLFQGRIRGSSRYLITRWADGVPLSTALVHRTAFPIETAFENAGALLGRLHAQSVAVDETPGRIFPLAPAASVGFGAADFLGRFAIATVPFRERFGDPLWDRVSVAIEVGLDACKRVLVEVVLCHGDYQPKNLIFDEAGQLQALLDWELAAFAPRLADLVHLLRYAPSDAVEDSLRQGYGATCPLPDAWTRAARCYDLVRVSLAHVSLLRV